MNVLVIPDLKPKSRYNPVGELMGGAVNQPGVNSAAVMMVIGSAASWVNPGRVVERD